MDGTLRSAPLFVRTPDVVLIGEMRDHETIASAITIAETGHLVLPLSIPTLLVKLWTESLMFSCCSAATNCQQLAGVIRAVVSQRLVPKKVVAESQH